jgi:hypothetical protein
MSRGCFRIRVVIQIYARLLSIAYSAGKLMNASHYCFFPKIYRESYRHLIPELFRLTVIIRLVFLLLETRTDSNARNN